MSNPTLVASTPALFAEHDNVFVDGEWRRSHSHGRLEIINPTTEEVVAVVPDGDADDIDAAVRAARRAFPAWRSTTPDERADALRRLAVLLVKDAELLGRTTTTENGTPISEAGSAGIYSAAHLRVVAELASELVRVDVRRNPLVASKTIVERTPLGVAGLIAPWNFPLPLIIAKLAPALLAGCTTVIKPAPETPIATRRLMELVDAAGIPAGVVNLVTGGVDAGRALVAHPDVDKISFTGSTPAGREIGEVRGRMLRPVTLELGGKSAAIVLDDADIDVVRGAILKVSFRNTGQTCKASTRLLVPRARHDEIVEAIVDVVGGAQLGDPTDPATVFGPVVSSRQRNRVNGYIEAGMAEGARAAIGGGIEPPLARGFYVQPTIFAGVEPGMTIAREEIFGPVLSVLAYDDVDGAVRLANDSEFGLSGTVFGADEDRALDVARRIETGTVGINHYGSNPAAPFSGHKDSGLGVEFGAEGLAGYLGYTSLHLLGD